MIRELIIGAVVSAFVSGVIAVLFFGYIKRAIDKRMDAADALEKKNEEFRQRRRIIQSKRWQTLGRFLYWTKEAFENGGKPHDGDISRAYDAYNEAENEDKSLDREIIAAQEGNQ